MSDSVSRRGFIAAGLGATLGAPLAALAACASTARPGQTTTTTTTTTVGPAAAVAASGAGRPLGLQLYTMRNLMERDVEGTLRIVADAGYKEVEFAGYFGRDPKALRATLDGLGLAAPSAHIPIDVIRASLDQTLDAAATLGHQYIICPFLMPNDRTADSFRRVAADLNRAGEAARARGMRVGYHNHDFEFAALPGGERGMDLLLAGTDPALVAFEMDLYWVTYAGQDPLALFARAPGRFELWHVKDLGTVNGARTMVPVGTGTIDFARIYAQRAQAGVRHLIVEQDNAQDPPANIRTSYAGLRRIVG